MSAVELLDVNAVAPDSVEVVESYRTWKLDKGKLVSHNGIAWKPGEPLHAECRGGSGTDYEVALVRRGASLEKIAGDVEAHNQQQSQWNAMYWRTSPTHIRAISWLDVPAVEPPAGYGYAIQPVPHETPHENCTCGIYSGTSLDICPAGDVRGKVKLWGKLVPGEKGYRAEYAYPSEFIVPASLADDPTLLAFGVPITVDDSVPAPALGGLAQFISTNSGSLTFNQLRDQADGRRRTSPWLKFAIALNLGSAAVNLSLIGAHLLA